MARLVTLVGAGFELLWFDLISLILNHQVGDIGGGWWNGLYLDYFLLLTFGGIPWQVSMVVIMVVMLNWMILMTMVDLDNH